MSRNANNNDNNNNNQSSQQSRGARRARLFAVSDDLRQPAAAEDRAESPSPYAEGAMASSAREASNSKTSEGRK